MTLSLRLFKSICTRRYAVSPCKTLARGFRLYSTETMPLTEPVPTSDRVYPEKLKNLVSEISKLNLLEVADLTELLRKTLNIPNAPMMSFGSMPMATAPKEEVEEEQAPQKIQTLFTLKMTAFDEGRKINLIKELKSCIEGMNLVQAKKFVDSLPQIVRPDMLKEEAEELKKKLDAAGATCAIE